MFIVIPEFDEEQVENLIRTMRPYGLAEIARTGRIAMARGASTVRVEDEKDAVAAATHHLLGRRPDRAMPYVSD